MSRYQPGLHAQSEKIRNPLKAGIEFRHPRQIVDAPPVAADDIQSLLVQLVKENGLPVHGQAPAHEDSQPLQDPGDQVCPGPMHAEHDDDPALQRAFICHGEARPDGTGSFHRSAGVPE
jgi:hypothetical protein